MATEDFDRLTREIAAARGASSRPEGAGTAADLSAGAPTGPRLDVEALVEIMARERPDGRDLSREERLQALRAWREALVRRHELAQRPPVAVEAEVAWGAESFREPWIEVEGVGDSLAPGAALTLDLRGLERASSHAEIDRIIPPFSHRGRISRALARWVAKGVSFVARFVTTRQSLVNSILIEYVAETAHRLNEQQARVDRLATGARRLLEQQRDESAASLRELQTAVASLSQGVGRLQRSVAEERGKSRDQELEIADIQCAKTWAQVAELDGREDLGRVRRGLSQLAARIAGQEDQVRRLEARLAGQDTDKVEHESLMAELGTRLESLTQGLSALHIRFDEQAERGQSSALEAIEELASRIDSLQESLADLEEGLGGEGQQEPVPADGAQPGHLSTALDGLYVNLENQFRGSRELIVDRLSSYLPLLAETGAGTVDHPVLDLGSGRGEWLELLRSRGLSARGIEVNTVAVSNCRTLGLDVTGGDALELLREQPGRSVGMITAFHLLEHLPFDYIVELLGESLRVLEPGGVALFETPNPENLVVSGKSFHCDPTHHKPLVPELLVFLMQQQGFSNLRIERQTQGRPDDRLQTLAESDPLAERLNPIIGLLNRHFAAPSDFAVIGYRSA